jgi:DNA invertase Pin-like site-specific DNA recombinase
MFRSRGDRSCPKLVLKDVDTGSCGARESRPALDKLMLACRKRLVDAVVVYRYDRFARSLRSLVNALEEFRSLDMDFISIHEGVDTSTPNGRLDLWHLRQLWRSASCRSFDLRCITDD